MFIGQKKQVLRGSSQHSCAAIMSASSICNTIGSVLVCLIVSFVAGEIVFRQYNSFFDVEEMQEAPLNRYNLVDFGKKKKSAALFLYNETVDAHHTFLHDVRTANQGHAVDVYQLECTAHKSICSSFGHGQVHEYEEPPVMFFHHNEWSESYHDDMQTGKVPKPQSRATRVAAIVSWLDAASTRGGDKLAEREMMINRLRSEKSPSQRMREMMDEQAKKKTEL